MKQIYFRKTLLYDPRENGRYSLYKGYSKSTLQVINLEILQVANIRESIDPQVIYSSHLLRAKQTATLFKSTYGCTELIILKDLAEVRFDLETLVSKKEFDKEGSSLVRKRFIDAFITDSLLESREQIKNRVESVLSILEFSLDTIILLISHSFFMKLFEVYLVHKDLFEKPDKLRKHFDYRIKTFPFGGGFSFQM
ncbi:MAG: histidine phosphatase family protein [Patescibacteria group bacterium]